MDGDDNRDFIELAKSHYKMDTSYFKLCAIAAALISLAEDNRRIANTLEDTTKSHRQGGSKSFNVDSQ